MARTSEEPGWTSQFREIVLSVRADLHDVRGPNWQGHPALTPDNYRASQVLAKNLKGAKSDCVVYPSTRHAGRRVSCPALPYPDCASAPVQGRHLEYHWDGESILCAMRG